MTLPDRVPDPVFGLVESPDYPWLSNEPVYKEWLRLRGLHQLGLAHLVFPGATHNRFQHHLGVHHLVNQVSPPPVSGDHLLALRVIALLGGIGHLPGGYAVERAVIRAARKAEQVCEQLQRLLDPVERRVAEYAASQGDAPTRWRDMLDRGDYRSLHAWFTAYKLARFRIDDVGHRDRLLYHRVSRRSPVNRWYRFLSRVDYVQRDPLYVGFARVELPVPTTVVAEDGLPHPLAERLTKQLADYLREHLYWDTRLFTGEELLSREISSLLCEGRISLEQLLEWTDDDLERELGIQTLERGYCVVARFETEGGSEIPTSTRTDPVTCTELADKLSVPDRVIVSYDRIDGPSAARDVFTILSHTVDVDAVGLIRSASGLAQCETCKSNPKALGHCLREVLGYVLHCDIGVSENRIAACEEYLRRGRCPIVPSSLADGIVDDLTLLIFARWLLSQYEAEAEQAPEMFELLAVAYGYALRIQNKDVVVLPWAVIGRERRENEVDVLAVGPLAGKLVITLIEASCSDSSAKSEEDQEKCERLGDWFRAAVPDAEVRTVIVNPVSLEKEVLTLLRQVVKPIRERYPQLEALVRSAAYRDLRPEVVRHLLRKYALLRYLSHRQP